MEPPYDGVTLIEVIEHVRYPKIMAEILYSLLAAGGILFVSTQVTDEITDFTSWWYKEDITHISFFTEHGLKSLMGASGFTALPKGPKGLFSFRKRGHMANNSAMETGLLLT